MNFYMAAEKVFLGLRQKRINLNWLENEYVSHNSACKHFMLHKLLEDWCPSTVFELRHLSSPLLPSSAGYHGNFHVVRFQDTRGVFLLIPPSNIPLLTSLRFPLPYICVCMCAFLYMTPVFPQFNPRPPACTNSKSS